MRIHVGEPELVPQLVEYLEEQVDCVVAQVGEDEIEVSLLGSFGGERHDAEVTRLVEAFLAQDRGTAAASHGRNGQSRTD